MVVFWAIGSVAAAGVLVLVALRVRGPRGPGARIRARFRAEARTADGAEDYAGRHAVVTVAVPDDGVGEVALTIGGRRTTLRARSAGALPPGVRVTVRATLAADLVEVVPVGYWAPEPLEELARANGAVQNGRVPG